MGAGRQRKDFIMATPKMELIRKKLLSTSIIERKVQSIKNHLDNNKVPIEKWKNEIIECVCKLLKECEIGERRTSETPHEQEIKTGAEIALIVLIEYEIEEYPYSQKSEENLLKEISELINEVLNNQ